MTNDDLIGFLFFYLVVGYSVAAFFTGISVFLDRVGGLIFIVIAPALVGYLFTFMREHPPAPLPYNWAAMLGAAFMGYGVAMGSLSLDMDWWHNWQDRRKNAKEQRQAEKRAFDDASSGSGNWEDELRRRKSKGHSNKNPKGIIQIFSRTIHLKSKRQWKKSRKKSMLLMQC